MAINFFVTVYIKVVTVNFFLTHIAGIMIIIIILP